MARLITVEIRGEAGQYEAMVRRIQDQHQRLYRDAQTGAQQTAAGMRIWETSIEGLGRQLIALAGIGSLGILTKQMLDFGEATVKAASESQQAIVSLQTALQTTGRNIPVGGIQEFAAELQKTTRFEDEAI